jgi:multidrug resistance protein
MSNQFERASSSTAETAADNNASIKGQHTGQLSDVAPFAQSDYEGDEKDVNQHNIVSVPVNLYSGAWKADSSQQYKDPNDIETQALNNGRKVPGILRRLSDKQEKPEQRLPPPTIPITDLDNGVIGWESQDDPEMPLNFAPRRKWLMVGLLAAITFMTPFASSILAPAISSFEDEFDEHGLVKGSMPVSIFLLGYAVGPLFLSPMSEIYGRNIVLVTANAFFAVWLIGCALAPSIDTLIFFRFMSGVGGSACQTIGGGIIADLFPISERGRAMTVWMVGPIFGPSLAPVIGGYVSQIIGWRWVSWITFIPAIVVVILMLLFNRETNAQVLIKRKTERLGRELGRSDLRSCYVAADAAVLTKGQILRNGLVRPLKMLFQSVILFSVSLYIAFAYGCLYLLFNTIPMVFQDTYGWSVGTTGLVYLSLLTGYAVGLVLFNTLSDKTVIRMTAANGGVFEPEMRLPDCIWFALVLPITFFWYGWTADKAVHFMVPIIGIVPFSTGIIGVWLPINAYIIDAFPQYAASGLAAFSVMRSVVAAFLPLAGPKMYESLGIGWGTSVLGFVAVGLIPVPALVYKFGKRLRERFPVKL